MKSHGNPPDRLSACRTERSAWCRRGSEGRGDEKSADIAAVAEVATGLALALVPSAVGQLLLGVEFAGIAVPVARVAGIALIGLGIACWPVLLRVVGTLATAYWSYAGISRYLGIAGGLGHPAVAGGRLYLILTVLLARAAASDRGTKAWTNEAPARLVMPGPTHAGLDFPVLFDAISLSPKCICAGRRGSGGGAATCSEGSRNLITPVEIGLRASGRPSPSAGKNAGLCPLPPPHRRHPRAWPTAVRFNLIRHRYNARSICALGIFAGGGSGSARVWIDFACIRLARTRRANVSGLATAF